MRCASWALTMAVVGSVVACSLTTSLSGLSSGGPVEPAGGDASPSADAHDDATTDAAGDGAIASDATSEGGGGSGYRAMILAEGPLAYYRLADQGGTAKDETGAHDGIYKGTVTHAAGAIAGDMNGAAVFDGSSGYVDVGDVLPFLARASFTIEAWVSPASGGTDPECIASKSYAQGGLSGGITEGYTVYLDSGSNTLNLMRLRASAGEAAQGGTLTNGTFAHVVATYDGDTLTLWMNGASVASGPSTRDLVSHTSPLTLGASRGGIYCYFRGALDEVAIYGAVLPQDRIAAHLKAGRGP